MENERESGGGSPPPQVDGGRVGGSDAAGDTRDRRYLSRRLLMSRGDSRVFCATWAHYTAVAWLRPHQGKVQL